MKSDQNQPHDPTENWLRQTLGGFQPDAPEDAWQRLAPHLPLRKRRRPSVFWLSSVAAGAAAVALFWFLKNAETPAAPPILVEKMPPIAQVLQNSSDDSKSSDDCKSPDEKLQKPSDGSKSSDEKLQPQNPLAKRNYPQKNRPKPASILPKNRPATNSSDDLESSVERLTANSSDDLESSDERPPVFAEKAQPEIQFSAAPIFPKKAKFPRFWLGIEAAPSLFMRKNMGGMPSGLVFPEMHSRPGNGWLAGLSLAFAPLKNWRVASGIQHFQQNHEAQHSATLRLMDGVHLNPHVAGLKEYEFQYAVVSGGEQSDLTLRLQQQDIGTTMPDDEPFTLDMKTVHRSTAWRVPLTVERRFGMGNWSGFVRGGAVVVFSEKSTVEVTHFTEVCQDLCFQGGHVPKIRASAPNKIALGWLVGAGIERQVFSRAGLRFEPFLVGQKGSMQCGLNFGLLFSN